MIPRYLRVVGASLSDTKLYTALNQTVLSIQSWKLCCFFSGFGGGSWEPDHLGVDMLQSKVIHRPGFCTVQMGFRSASQNFVMFSSWLKFVYGLDPHAILPLQAAACRHTLSQVMCAQLHAQTQTCPQDLATSVRARRGPTEGISGLAHRSAECCPTSSLASCCPRAPTSRLPTGGLILPPAAEGAMPTGTRLKVATQEPLCVSVLFSTHCFLFLFKLKYKCKMCRKRER